MSEVKKVSLLVYVFQTSRKINVAAILYEHLTKSLLRKWIYYMIPISVFSVNIFNMINNGVLYTPSNKFTYFNDLSNSLCLSFLYFLSYFLSGYYPLKFDEFIQKGIDKNFLCEMTIYSQKKKKSYFLLLFLGAVLFAVAIASGYSFYHVAKSNVDAYWIYNLDGFGRIYYCIFLGITWYHLLSLLVMALTSGFLVYRTIEYNRLIYIDDDFNIQIKL